MTHYTAQRDSEAPQIDDHAIVRQALKRAKRAEDEATLKAVFEDLASCLDRHFAKEERADGLFRAIIERAPRHEHAVRELREEHRAIVASARQILAPLTNTQSAISAAAADAVAKFVEILSAHEQREEALLQDSFD